MKPQHRIIENLNFAFLIINKTDAIIIFHYICPSLSNCMNLEMHAPIGNHLVITILYL